MDFCLHLAKKQKVFHPGSICYRKRSSEFSSNKHELPWQSRLQFDILLVNEICVTGGKAYRLAYAFMCRKQSTTMMTVWEKTGWKKNPHRTARSSTSILLEITTITTDDTNLTCNTVDTTVISAFFTILTTTLSMTVTCACPLMFFHIRCTCNYVAIADL